jgi:hypothetical protein
MPSSQLPTANSQCQTAIRQQPTGTGNANCQVQLAGPWKMGFIANIITVSLITTFFAIDRH